MSESENVQSLLRDAGLRGDLRAVLEAGSAHDPTPGELAGLSSKLAALLPPGTLPPAPAAPAAPLAGGGLSGAAKLAVAIAVIGAVGGAAWLARSPDATTPVPGATPVIVAPPSPSEAVTSAAPVVTASAAPTVIGTASATPIVTAPRPSSTSAASAAPLAPESLMISRAHDALLQGAPDRALALAADHARAYPKGALAQEREVIAIEALVAQGRKADGRSRATSFRTAYPGSAHLGRIERLVGGP